MSLGNTSTQVLTVLLESGRITEEQYKEVERLSAESGTPAEDIVVQRKFADDDLVAKAKGMVLGVPYIDLVGKDIPSDVLNLISKEASENAQSVAFAREGRSVSIGMIDPRDPAARQALDFLAQTAGFTPSYHIITKASFAYAAKRYGVIGKEVETALEAAEEKYAVPEKTADGQEGKLEEVIKGAPVSRIVSVILRHAVEGGASDIHIEPLAEETRVRYRVDGVLRAALTLPKYIHSSLISRIKVLANLKLDETRIPQDGRIRETFGDKAIDFRVSTLPLQDSEKVVMRILDTTRGVPTLEQLGFRKQYIDIIAEEIKKPHGMFLITGPTGSGKSTTLFTVLNMRNEDGINISTLEDPVEYTIKGVNQAQVRPEVGFGFAEGLRALLRQDPNVIMVGEIRDGETGELAIHAALTGHLVFSTLHTNDAYGIVPRLTDMRLEPFLIAATMNLGIAQRLARKICERCRAETDVPAEVEASIVRLLEPIPQEYKAHLTFKSDGRPQFYKGRGCLRCNDTGYVGRVAIAEVLRFDDAMRQIVAEGFTTEKADPVARKSGFLTMQQDGVLKALEGLTTIEEVMRVTSE